MSSLTRRALGGVAWTWAGSGVLIVAQIASTAATARLVAPREFGVYATAQAAAGVAGYFTMGAVGSGLQRRSQLGEKTAGTAMSLSLATSLAVALALFLAASPWARAWGVPEAAPIVRVVALTLFLTGAAAVPSALIRRRLRFGTAAIIGTGTQVFGLGASVALAAELHSALALALGQTIAAATLLVVAAVIVKDELRLSFDRADASELSTFAGQVGILGLGEYAAATAPSWFVARALGASQLGLFSRASLIVSLPLTYAASGVMTVLYPLYGRVRGDLSRTKVLLDEGLTLTTGLAWPAFALAAGASPVIVRVLLGPRWHAAAPLVALFALIACGTLPTSLLTNAAEAIGWMRLIGARQLMFAACTATTLATVYVADLGMYWLLAGIAASQWVTYVSTVASFVRRGLLDSNLIVRAQGIHAGVSLAAYGLAVACTHATGGLPIVAQVLSVAGAALAVFAVLFTFRSLYPAGSVLKRRLAQAFEESSGSRLARIGAASR